MNTAYRHLFATWDWRLNDMLPSFHFLATNVIRIKILVPYQAVHGLGGLDQMSAEMSITKDIVKLRVSTQVAAFVKRYECSLADERYSVCSKSDPAGGYYDETGYVFYHIVMIIPNMAIGSAGGAGGVGSVGSVGSAGPGDVAALPPCQIAG